MADKKKSILDEALLDAKRIQEALNANSKEILASVTKEEIDSIVKESLEEDYLEEDVDDTEEELEVTADDAGMEDEAEGEIEVGTSDDETGDDIESDELEGDYESGMDAEASDDEIEMDMTAASDDDVIAVYKKLTGDDEIEVVIDTDASEIQISVEEPGEYVIKTDEAGEEPMEEEYMEEKEMEEGEHMEEKEMCEDDAMEEEYMEEEHMEEGIDEIMYEIALDEETMEEETMEEGEHMEEKEMCEDDAMEEEYMEEEMTEEGEKLEELISKNHADEGKAGGDLTTTKAPGAEQAAKYYGHETNESKVIEKYNTLLTEAKELKGKNEEYKQALKQFRTMLAETVVFNSNLTYTTKLMMEHSTTKDEKENILKRFDNEVSTLKESKKLYKTIESELKNRKPINESIENKIIKEVSTSKSAQLNESTAYVDKETSRIMDLMKRVNKR